MKNVSALFPSGTSMGKMSQEKQMNIDIDNLDPRLNRRNDQIDYFLTQLLCENGGFQSYLHKIGNAWSPDYVLCNGVANDADHTFFSCEKWDGFHPQLYEDTGELSPDNIVREILRSAGM